MWKKIALSLLAAAVILIAAYLIWAANPPAIGEHAEALMQSSDDVEVIENDGVIFSPKNPNGTAFLFYPGARVRPEAYAVEMHPIAAAGFTVIVPKMPFNMAAFHPGKATKIIADHPEIDNWVIGGHSLGGAMAGVYLGKHRELDGIIFWASYPPNNTNLSDYEGVVSSISGELDGLATPQKVDASRQNLPKSAEYLQIQGGNHAQFGDYGAQSGDNPATITPEDQWNQIIKASLKALEAAQSSSQ